MNRWTISMFTIVVSCAEPSTELSDAYPDASVSAAYGSVAQGTDAGSVAASESHVATGSGASDGAAQGAGGVGGNGGSDSACGHASSSDSSAATTTVEASSTSVGAGSDSVDCTTVPINSPCETGLCAPDGVCRRFAECRGRIGSAFWSFDCLDRDLSQMYIDSHGTRYTGCHYGASSLDKIDPVTCSPGDDCIVNVYPGINGQTQLKGDCAP